MKSSKFVRYDSKSDTLYIVAGRGMEKEFVEVAPGVNVELDAKGDVIGIEILKASKFSSLWPSPCTATCS